MNKKELLELIDSEVSKVVKEPMREPQRPVVQAAPVKRRPPSLQHEDEIDNYLFKSGMKEPEESKHRQDTELIK
jgi:hypothetical protein